MKQKKFNHENTAKQAEELKVILQGKKNPITVKKEYDRNAILTYSKKHPKALVASFGIPTKLAILVLDLTEEQYKEIIK